MAIAHPDLRIDHTNRIVYRADAPVPGKVALVSGGGTGHEPLHGGYVGRGMLDAACARRGLHLADARPDAGRDEGRRRRRRCAAHRQELHRRRAELRDGRRAGAMPRASRSNRVVVDDDVAVKDSTYTAGRRGVGGHGVRREDRRRRGRAGRSLAEVADVARRVERRVRSMGVALTSCTVPAVGHPTLRPADDEIEIGIGIHGEPGRERMPLQPARAVADSARPGAGRPRFSGGDGVILFVNSMGGTPLIELYVMYSEFAAILDEAGVGLPAPGRPLRHQPRHGRLLGHAAARRRRAAAAVGPPGQHARLAEGSVRMAPTRRRPLGRCCTAWREFAREIGCERRNAHRSRRGHRRRRPRHQHGPRHDGGARRCGTKRPALPIGPSRCASRWA